MGIPTVRKSQVVAPVWQELEVSSSVARLKDTDAGLSPVSKLGAELEGVAKARSLFYIFVGRTNHSNFKNALQEKEI